MIVTLSSITSLMLSSANESFGGAEYARIASSTERNLVTRSFMRELLPAAGPSTKALECQLVLWEEQFRPGGVSVATGQCR